MFPELSVANKVTCFTPTSLQLKVRSPLFKNVLEFFLVNVFVLSIGGKILTGGGFVGLLGFCKSLV